MKLNCIFPGSHKAWEPIKPPPNWAFAWAHKQSPRLKIHSQLANPWGSAVNVRTKLIEAKSQTTALPMTLVLRIGEPSGEIDSTIDITSQPGLIAYSKRPCLEWYTFPYIVNDFHYFLIVELRSLH
jgi:hypothetical protein